MANRTVKDASTVKGTNPQYLVEKIIRTRIYDCKYWKEECFALTAELLVDKAMELKYIGGVYAGNIKPAPFLCLVLKMLQIQPDKDIIIEFIKNEDFKYVRALGAFYLRLVGTSIDCYKYLEPLLNDYRKVRMQGRDGKFALSHMDEYIDELLREERLCDVILPRIQKRHVLEEANEIDPRISLLEADDLDEEELDEDDDEDEDGSPEDEYARMQKRIEEVRDRRERKRSRSRSRERDRERDRDRDRNRWDRKDRRRARSSSRDRGAPKKRPRSRSRSRDRNEQQRGHDRHRGDHHQNRDRTRSNRDKDREGDRQKDKNRDKHSNSSSKKERNDGGKDSMSIEETNKLRASLGLGPLK